MQAASSSVVSDVATWCGVVHGLQLQSPAAQDAILISSIWGYLNPGKSKLRATQLQHGWSTSAGSDSL